MRLFLRWSVAVAGMAVVLAGGWALCTLVFRLDEGAAWGISGAAAGGAMVVLGWWAVRTQAGDDHESEISAAVIGLGQTRVSGVATADGARNSMAVGNNSGLVIGAGSAISSPVFITLGTAHPGPADQPKLRIVTGNIPQKPPGFQPRGNLLEKLNKPAADPHPAVVYVLTGMRGAGKTHLAAAHARACLAEGWRLVAWVSAEDSGTLRRGLADVAAALELDIRDGQGAGEALRHRLEVDGGSLPARIR